MFGEILVIFKKINLAAVTKSRARDPFAASRRVRQGCQVQKRPNPEK